MKTISCENSFRRGTVVTPVAVWKGMEELYRRLPRLLMDRREWSKHPSRAYPTTIRLTARVVDQSLQMNNSSRRRPFVTRSKQVPFRGQELMEEADADKQNKMVQDAVRPLVQSLVLHSPDPGGLNVTRLNIAATNFQDVNQSSILSPNQQPAPGTSRLITAFATQRASQVSPAQKSFSTQSGQQITQSAIAKRKVPYSTQYNTSHRSPKRQRTGVTKSKLPGDIDPTTLAELPPDMAKQIVRDYKDVVRSNATKTPGTTKSKPSKIDHFFRRK